MIRKAKLGIGHKGKMHHGLLIRQLLSRDSAQALLGNLLLTLFLI